MSARKRKKRKRINPEQLRRKLKLKHLQAQKRLRKKHPKVDKFFRERDLDPGKIREHSVKIIGAGAIAGSLLLSPPSPVSTLPSPKEIIEKLKNDDLVSLKSPKKVLVDSLKSILPKRARPLSGNEEKVLEQVFQQLLGISARTTLEKQHLNTTYGYIGAEQHLRRYPGDSLSAHAPTPNSFGGVGHGEGQILRSGIAPGLGAWGYFALSKSSMTKELEETEKWYAVVQTLYLPEWNTNQPFLKNWYKHRKVLIVNTENGNAVVAAIADSGPAAWTGKHFGGSPEVMNHLGGSRYKKGPVVIFFVDDPENKVPLGPVNYE